MVDKVFVAGLLLAVVALLNACASMPSRDPLAVTVAASSRCRGRAWNCGCSSSSACRTRTTRRSEFDGVALNLDVQGRVAASGVSAETGVVPVSAKPSSRAGHGFDVADGAPGRRHARRTERRQDHLCDERQVERHDALLDPAVLGHRRVRAAARVLAGRPELIDANAPARALAVSDAGLRRETAGPGRRRVQWTAAARVRNTARTMWRDAPGRGSVIRAATLLVAQSHAHRCRPPSHASSAGCAAT